MKKILILSCIILSIFGSTGVTGVYAFECQSGYVENDQGTGCNQENILGEKNSDLRTGNVSMETIPKIIISVINVLLGVAGTVAVVALIYYAVQMQLASGITGDSSKVDNAKRGMTGALIGFVVAILAWFIVIRFVEILSSVS